MRTMDYDFNTKAEAKAFQEGVELVNDSTIRVVNVRYAPQQRLWIAVVEDDDADPDESGESQ